MPLFSSPKNYNSLVLIALSGTTLTLAAWLLIKGRAAFSGLPEPATQFPWTKHDAALIPPTKPLDINATLVIASNMYVISLPAREDRRKDLEILRSTLGLEWTYRDGVDRDTDPIQMVLDQVRQVREGEHPTGLYDPATAHVPFAWPADMDSRVAAKGPIEPFGSDLWHVPQAVAAWEPRILTATSEVLTCSKENNTLFPYHDGFERHQLLTRSVVACWESHLNVIRSIANQEIRQDDPTGGAAIVLEDDVDMEQDIRDRLGRVWGSLPPDWDIVYLGHCWAPNENKKPAIDAEPPAGSVNVTRLHPSTEPLCMHGYAVSRNGARRILLHLTHLPFAYSRAVDQALAWLITSGRVKSFSVVPSTIVQRKATNSDILGEAGTKFRQGLYNGVFHTVSAGIFQ